MLRQFGFALILAAAAPVAAAAQSVDRYQFLQLEKQVTTLSDEVGRLNTAIASGATQDRLNGLEDSITRLTGQVERLEHIVREQGQAAKLKLEDLEYRIVVLEGGDPNVLFQDQESAAPAAAAPVPAPSTAVAPAPAPATGTVTGLAPSPTPTARPQTSGTLGSITTPIPGGDNDKARLDSGIYAIRSGQAAEGKRLLEGMLDDYPNSPLAGDAYFWLGESLTALGDYRAAANRYLDSSVLFPGSPMAPEAMLKLGVSLTKLGDVRIACDTFAEIFTRYPNATAVLAQTSAESRRAGCS